MNDTRTRFFCLCMSLSPLPAAAEDTEMALTLSDAETFDAAKGTHINATNFPDPVFRQFVEDSFDTDGDLVLTEEEVADVTEINVRAKGIASLEGIWAFPNLVTLNCSDNNLQELVETVGKNRRIFGCQDIYLCFNDYYFDHFDKSEWPEEEKPFGEEMILTVRKRGCRSGDGRAGRSDRRSALRNQGRRIGVGGIGRTGRGGTEEQEGGDEDGGSAGQGPGPWRRHPEIPAFSGTSPRIWEGLSSHCRGFLDGIRRFADQVGK